VVIPVYSAGVISRNDSNEESYLKDFSLPLEMTGQSVKVNDIDSHLSIRGRLKQEVQTLAILADPLILLY
jgi:hypothetical protein